MPARRLTHWLAKLEQQAVDPETARLRSIEWLQKILREAEERDGPLPPPTPESEARLREFWNWLAERSPDFKSGPLYRQLSGKRL